jgi:hypothetical protein
MIKTFRVICSMLIASVVLQTSCGGGSDYKYPELSGTLIEDNSNDWGQIRYNGNYRLVNNVWNKGAATGGYAQRIFRETLNGGEAIGWQWFWPAGSTNVVAYPEVAYGDKPWDAVSGTVTPFPVRAGSVDITADFDILLNASGVYNMAFSIWGISNTSDPYNSITHEIMIWNVNHGMNPSGSLYDTMSVGGVNFDVYVSYNQGDASGGSSSVWTYVAFVRDSGDILSGPLDLSAFIDYLVSEGIMTTSHYITSVELGNEVVGGTGTAEIEHYAVTVTPRP